MYIPPMSRPVTLTDPAPVRALPAAARGFKALGDETRLRIILKLMHGERCVCDLVDDLGAAQSLLSFHLKTLKDAGLVTDRKQGRWVYYAVNASAIASLGGLLGEVREGASSSSKEVEACSE